MPKFVRFVVGGDDEHHRALTGLITESRLLRDEGNLSPHEVELVNATFDWFNLHLPRPPFKSSDWSRDAVAWFKDHAHEPIRRIRDLAVILDSHGHPVRTLRSRNPGKVLYEDDYQVVVEEWKHL